MGTVHREAGFRFVIFVNDHAPPHVHVFGEGEAKIMLAGADGGAEIVYNAGMSRRDLARAVGIVRRRAESFLMDWSGIHG